MPAHGRARTYGVPSGLLLIGSAVLVWHARLSLAEGVGLAIGGSIVVGACLLTAGWVDTFLGSPASAVLKWAAILTFTMALAGFVHGYAKFPIALLMYIGLVRLLFAWNLFEVLLYAGILWLGWVLTALIMQAAQAW